MEEQFYVYKIINITTGVIEHVGQTDNMERRWRAHTNRKPGSGCGKFYQRTDVVMVPISRHNSRAEALQQEKHWQRHYDVEDSSGFLIRKLTIEQVEEIRAKYVPYKYTQEQLAEEYGVTQTTIFRILKNKIYQK